MGLITRILPPDAKNAKLTFQEMDNNLYYLQSLGVSGFSYSNGTINITNPTGGTKSVTINKVTGFTYNNLNTFTITDNYNNNYSATFNVVTGLTVNGTISATTYQNLPPAVFTGGTVSGGTNFIAGLSANTISATTYQNLPIDPDTYVTGFTYSNNVFTIKQNNGQPDLTQTINVVTGLTVNGSLISNTISATTFLNVPSFANMSLGHSSLNPADETTYYIGGLQSLSPSTTNRDSWSMISQYSGNITEVSILSNFIGGSSENSTVSIQNLSANTSQVVTSTLKYVTGTPVQILFQPFSSVTQPSGWTSFLVTFSTYAGLTGVTSTLTSPLFDGSLYNTINVVTDVAKFGSGTDGPILVEYSLNSGSTWSSAGTTSTPTSTTYVTSTVVVPTTSSQMLIRFSVNPSGTSGKRLRNVFFNGVSSSLNDNYILSSPLSISNGDKLQIRWITPTWSTNPTNVTNLYNLKINL